MAQNAREYIESLSAKGEVSFTVKRFCRELDISYKSGLSAIERLRKKQLIASPSKGYYLILSPEFRHQGCLPADYFIDDLMTYWQKEYYVCLLSAALYHGAAHQQPQIFQVMLSGKRKNLNCGNVHIEFAKNIHCSQVPAQQIKTHTGYMYVSTPEATAKDLLVYMRKSGGVSRIATVLDELVEKISTHALIDLATSSDEFTWIHRLGFIFDKLGHVELAETLYQSICKQSEIIPLVPYASITGVPRDKKWGVAINAIMESDLNDSY